jgi:hypothetical protein
MSQRHRSHWTARIQNPSLNPHRFLPTPLPAKPLNQVKPAKVETPREIAPTPSRTAGEWRIFDRYNNYRSKISEDGTCTNNCNEVIGFLNIDGAQAGTMYKGFNIESFFSSFHQSTDTLVVMNSILGVLTLIGKLKMTKMSWLVQSILEERWYVFGYDQALSTK